MIDNRPPLFLPALRVKMGDWVYYISFMSMGEIARRISVVDDIHSSTSLKDWLQRMLTNNSKKIADYLVSQEQRLFNAIVVGTYGGSPTWHEISVKGRDGIEVPENVEGTMGLLELSGHETLFAIDGQHRVKGIKEATDIDHTLEEDEVCTIFVRGVTASERIRDSEGFQRTRRLFSTLNRYAKPVQKRDIIALDEDDVIAIVTRRLLEEHPLLIDKISTGIQKSMSPKDRTNLTTIVTLYDVVDIVLQNRKRGWSDYKRLRPPESEVDSLYQKANQFWDCLCRLFSPLSELRDSSPEDHVAGRYRSPDGGHLLFRPIGLLLIVRVAVELRSTMGMSDSSALEAVGNTPTDLSEDPWVGLLWDSTNRRMLTAKENQKLARRLLYRAHGGDLARYPHKTTSEALRRELAGILQRNVADVTLPFYQKGQRAV